MKYNLSAIIFHSRFLIDYFPAEQSIIFIYSNGGNEWDY